MSQDQVDHEVVKHDGRLSARLRNALVFSADGIYDRHRDLRVGMSDFVVFVPLFYNREYDIEVDFNYDSMEDLSDVIVFARFVNCICD